MAESLTVLIPTHGRPTLLGRTLDSLASCAVPEGYHSTWVIENGPKQGAEDVVRQAGEVHPHLSLRYLHCARPNKSHALNEALRYVSDGLLVFLDDDVRMQENVLTAYASAASGQEGGAYFGGPVAIDYEKRPPEWRLSTMPASVKGWRQSSETGEGEHPFLGFNWAAFKSDIVAAGGFDVERGPGAASGSTGQESDMQRRLLERGVARRYVPDALVWHFVPKERCSVRWALRRAYRVGVELGTIRGRGGLYGRGSLTLHRILAVVRAVDQIVRGMALLKKERIWKTIYQLFKAYGIADGVRISEERDTD